MCSDIGEGCFDDVCSFEWSTGLNDFQGIRFIFAMFLHRGIIDALIILLCQLYISWKIERKIGWGYYRALCGIYHTTWHVLKNDHNPLL